MENIRVKSAVLFGRAQTQTASYSWVLSTGEQRDFGNSSFPPFFLSIFQLFTVARTDLGVCYQCYHMHFRTHWTGSKIRHRREKQSWLKSKQFNSCSEGECCCVAVSHYFIIAPILPLPCKKLICQNLPHLKRKVTIDAIFLILPYSGYWLWFFKSKFLFPWKEETEKREKWNS